MRATVDIDDRLVEEAKRLTAIKTKKRTVEFIVKGTDTKKEG